MQRQGARPRGGEERNLCVQRYRGLHENDGGTEDRLPQGALGPYPGVMRRSILAPSPLGGGGGKTAEAPMRSGGQPDAPRKDEFAKRIIEAVRTAGHTTPIHYDAHEFRLRTEGEDGHIFHLTN